MVGVAVGVGGLLAAGVGLFIGYLAWHNPRSPDPVATTPTWDDAIKQYDGERFLEFLDDNKGRKVLLDATLDGAEFNIQVGPRWLAAERFTIWHESCPHVAPPKEPRVTDCGDEAAPGNVVSIDIDRLRDSPLTYAHGTWRLRGYMAVDGIVDVSMGYIVRRLVPIDLNEAVN